MSPNRRIALNVIATYGRSLLGLLCGLFTSRWALRALGVEAFGVYGVVCVIVTICSFLNALLTNAVGRHYAFAFGEAKAAADKNAAETNCRQWFNVALFLHASLSVIAALVACFAGEWAIDNYLQIPAQYVQSAHWLLLFSIVGMVIGLVSAPFKALYVAQQYIAELTIYDLLTPVLNLICAWTLLTYSGNRLVFYAFYMMSIVALPSVLITIRALFVFPECTVRLREMWNPAKMKQIFSFAGWILVGMSGMMLRTQGTSVIVNKLLGVQFNSTMGIANTVVSHAGSLSGALNGAFMPAVTNAAGAGESERFYALTFRSTKFGTILLALFFIPLSLEIDYIVHLWLDTIPPSVGVMCILMMACAVIDRCATGGMIAVNALGIVKWHEIWCMVLHSLTIVICYVLAGPMKMGIEGIGWGLVIGSALVSLMRMVVWKVQLRWPIRAWLNGFMLPFCGVTVLSVASGLLLVGLLSPSFVRLLLVGLFSMSVFGFGCYALVFDPVERGIIRNRLLAKLPLTLRH